MQSLFSKYSDQTLHGMNEFEMFKQFYDNERLAILSWLEERMEQLSKKNIHVADELRIKGNSLYADKKFHESLVMYTKALCHAPKDSENFVLILSNISAVLFMMKEYQACLDNINACLTSAQCSEITKLKLNVRKIKCCRFLNSPHETEEAVFNALRVIQDGSFADKNIKDFLHGNTNLWKQEIGTASKLKSANVEKEPTESIPCSLTYGVNKTFSSASQAIRLNYSEQKGRHVVAQRNLNVGDVIFIEKPFIFAPIFVNEDKEMFLNKCSHCLRTVKCCTTCQFCTKCVYCNDNCLEKNWEEFHQWECRGMQANLWYDVGIAFSAFRALAKGANCGFLTKKCNEDVAKYGDEENNYAYFNQLISNISKINNTLPMVITATVIILYLQEFTAFFDWILSCGSCPKELIANPAVYLGGLFVKHMAQLQCNASTVIHYEVPFNGDTNGCVACGVYPSISMMNHSCDPNISIEYIRDTAIVTVARKIEEGEEVYNCYGFDKSSNWKVRQAKCKEQYYFECDCYYCRNQL